MENHRLTGLLFILQRDHRTFVLARGERHRRRAGAMTISWAILMVASRTNCVDGMRLAARVIARFHQDVVAIRMGVNRSG